MIRSYSEDEGEPQSESFTRNIILSKEGQIKVLKKQIDSLL